MKKWTAMVTGGARSGKSRYAVQCAMSYGARAFVATATPSDAEMAERIRKHQLERADAFLTVEEDIDLAGAIRTLPAGVEVAVVDCLTVWLGNLLHVRGSGQNSFPEVEAFLELLQSPPCDLIVVTNEVGMGIVPENALAREFRDIAGRVNQNVATRADSVVLMVSGIPVVIK